MKKLSRISAVPVYEQIKQEILIKIESGDWPAGARVPSENELIAQLGVSRMTVNRALRELAAEGRLMRVQGVGTFVAEVSPASEFVELRNIADEIIERGRCHSAQALELSRRKASAEEAGRLLVDEGTEIAFSRVLHLENGQPVQLEERIVNLALVPGYPDQDFSSCTPNAYLTQVEPADEVEHRVEAVSVSEAIAKALNIASCTPSLLLRRRTWARGRVVSSALLYHPGDRYSLRAHFKI